MPTTYFAVEGTVLKEPTETCQPTEPFIRIIEATDAADAKRQVQALSSPFAPIFIDKVTPRHD